MRTADVADIAGELLPLSMNEITTFRWSFDEDVHHYEKAGYQALGVWLHKVHDYGEERAIERLAESSLAVSNLLWAGGFTGSDGRTSPESISETKVALELAGAMRAGCLVVYPGGRNNHTFRHAQRLLQSALDQLLPVAEQMEVPLAIEPMHPACAGEWTFLTDMEAALDLVEAYSTPWLKVVYDTFHFPLILDEPSLISRMAPRLAIVHLADRKTAAPVDQERCPLGAGGIPLAGIVSSLLEAGYDGYFDVKLIGHEIECISNRQLLYRSREEFQRMMAACQRLV